MAFVMAGLFWAVPAFGQNVSWTGNTSTNWNTVSNWSSASVPGSSSNVTVDTSSGNQPVITGGNYTISNMYVGNKAMSGNTSLVVQNGAILNFGNGGLAIGESNGSIGNVTVSGSNSAINLSTILEVGFMGTGTLTVSNGATLNTGGGNPYLGYSTGGYGTLLVTGNGSSFINTNSFGMFFGGAQGSGGGGSFTVANGASASLTDIRVTSGNASTSYLTVTGANSQLVLSDSLRIFGEYSQIVYTVSNGGNFTCGNISIQNATVTDPGSLFAMVGQASVSPGNLTIANGGEFMVEAGGSVSLDGTAPDNGTINLNGGTLQVGGIDGIVANSANYAFNFGGGTLQVAGSDLSASINATLIANTTSTIDTNGFNATWSGLLGGAGGITKIGNGTLTLDGLDTETGKVTINGGTIFLGDANALGNPDMLAVNLGALDLNSQNITVSSLSGNFGGNGRITDSSSGNGTTTVTVNGTVDCTYSGTISNGPSKTVELIKAGTNNLSMGTAPDTVVINGGTLTLGSETSNTSNITDNSNLVFMPEGHNAMIQGSISGGGSLTFNLSLMTGALYFEAIDTFTGNTAINAGQIVLYDNISSLGGKVVDNGTVNIFQGQDESFNGDISGSGGLVYSGANPTPTDATLTFYGNITYTGNTLVEGGTLNFTQGFTVANGATLSGSGSIDGAIIVNGTLGPGYGGGVGSLTFSQNLTLGGTATLNLQIGGTTLGTQYSAINVAGNLMLGGTLALTFINGYTPTPGTTFNFFQVGGGVTGSFANVTLPTLNSNLAWDTSQLAATGNISASAINYTQWTAVVGLSGNNALPDATPFNGEPANVIRYAMNLDTIPAPSGAPILSTATLSGANYLTLQYRTRKDMSDYQLVPQSSTDLQTWTDVDAGNITQLPDADAYTAQFQASAALPADGPVFLRVVAEPLP